MQFFYRLSTLTHFFFIKKKRYKTNRILKSLFSHLRLKWYNKMIKLKFDT